MSPRWAGGESTPQPTRREASLSTHMKCTHDEVSYAIHLLPFTQGLLTALMHQPLVIVFDGSVVGRGCVTLMVSVIYKRRALPIAWLVRQGKNAWPHLFRKAHLFSAVDYVQAMRLRSLLIEKMHALMSQVDVCVAPSWEGKNLLITNLVGLPAVVLPNGFRKNGEPTSITFTGKLFGEAEALLVAKRYQDATDFHLKHPA